MNFCSRLLVLLSSITVCFGTELVIKVTGIKDSRGAIGCALYPSETGFPMNAEKAKQLWLKAKPDSVECQFEGIPAGKDADAVSRDLNGNRKTDTNFLGIPKEDWGVSNNVGPNFRTQRFDEAAFEVLADGIRIEIGIFR
jgi:uncharacterized protein (DUF2141 family)